MKAYTYLPEGYMEKFQINLQKDPATAKKVNIGGAREPKQRTGAGGAGAAPSGPADRSEVDRGSLL
jgi:hypothetical protein